MRGIYDIQHRIAELLVAKGTPLWFVRHEAIQLFDISRSSGYDVHWSRWICVWVFYGGDECEVVQWQGSLEAVLMGPYCQVYAVSEQQMLQVFSHLHS